MRLFSSKKICIMIASAGLLFAGVLIGTSVIRQHGARRTFEEEGYILTMTEDEDQVIVNHENRFASGSAWSRAGISSVAFRDEDGDRVVVDNDSFIHYDSSSLAAVKDGAISDMDQYLDGVIGCCYLPAGNTLTWDGSGFTAQSTDGEKRFENFIWKNSEQRYLLGSSTFTIHFSGGKQEVSDSGFLELYYLGNDKKILQLTSGDQAWQVVSKDCTITFANGVVLNCEDGKITRSAQEAADNTDTSASAGTAQQTMSLQNIEIDATGSITLGSTQYSSFQPTFRFTLFDGQDGASGENGADGAPGEAGEDGEDGEQGVEGTAGQEGQAGSTGSTGNAGGAYTTVINGGVDTGVEIRTGTPAIIAPDNEWKITEASRSFRLVYEQEAYATVEVVPDKAYVYLYNVKTGEILQEWKNGVNIGSENSPGELFKLDSKVKLEMDTTYGLAAIDTYMLGGTTYTTKLFEKIFTTDSSGIQVQLQDRTSDSFILSVAGDSYTTIGNESGDVTVTFYDQNGVQVGEAEKYSASDPLSRLKIGKTAGLKSNTWYRMKVSVNCKVNNTYTTIEKELDWTTLKKEPVLGGLSLRAENGYLVAKVLGKSDQNTTGEKYADPEDTDHALESITYRLYDANGLLAANGTAKQETTSNSTADVYFKIDGALLMNQSAYYVIADYTWNDGAKSITVPVKESGLKKTSGNNVQITTDKLNGRAFAEAQALVNKGVSISFSGNGTRLYNLAVGDASEGTTYESIRGSLMVNLNGIKLSVNDTRQMILNITDNKTYEKSIKYNSCDGKQGDIEGSFAIPLDIDGLLENNTYALTLSAYTYDQSTGNYRYQAIGTLTIRTDTGADITMGMRQAVNGGTGVDFWLGSDTFTEAIGLHNYYNQDNKTYKLDNGDDGDSDYLAKTDASYRNLSSIVFELYKGSSSDPSPQDLVGTCTVYGTDNNGDRASFMPGYSILYQKYYGSAVENCKDNNVGVGESFAHQFEYNYDTTKQYGKIPESALSTISDGKFTIKVRVCYDYTYDRYNYDGDSGLYDYFIANSQLDMEDYVNELTVNQGRGLILPDMVYQNRPVAPSSVTARDGYAVTVDPLVNEEMGAYNGDSQNNEKYDAALLNDTTVGIDVKTPLYKDENRLAKTVSFYGTTYDKAENDWEPEKTLTEVRDNEDLFGFKFTLPMTKDGTTTDIDNAEKRRIDIPHLWLFMYDDRDTDLKNYLESQNFDSCQEGDRGYSYRKYDATNDVWLVYANTDFLKRGQTYVFAYDAELDFTINNNGGTFSYPGDYYENEWVSGKKYAKNTALRSQYTPLKKQEPQVDMELLTSTAAAEDSTDTGSTETFRIYLDDPDGAVRPDSLLGYTKDYEYVGCIYDAYGSPLTDQQSMDYNHFVELEFTAGGKSHSLHYVLSQDDLNKERIYANLDNAQVSALTGATDQQKAVMDSLITDMKKVETGVDGTVTSAGTTITVKSLDPGGVFYSWQVVYRLLDDYQSKNEQGRIPLTEHYYAGHETWRADSNTDKSFNLITANKVIATNGNYTVSTTVDPATNDIVNVEIERPEGPSSYYTDIQKIAAVKIAAKKWNADSDTWEPILEKTATGTLTQDSRVIWQNVKELSGSNFGFNFRISAFNQSEKGGDSQFNMGDKLQFTYTFYYDNGDRSTLKDISNNQGTDPVWYGLKSMNGKQSGSPLYVRASQKKDVQTVPLDQQGSLRQSIYSVASAQGTDTVKPQITRTAAKGNDRIWYITGIQQTYTLTKNPTNAGDLGDKKLTRTESLRYGTDEETGYRAVNVTEFCKLGEMTATAEVGIDSIAPTLSSHQIIPGITQMTMSMNIESYNLMAYPENENLHLYYALYKVTEEESAGGEPAEEKLELAGVMIGEPDELDEDNKLQGSRNILMDKLEKNQKYRLYVYYKDNRDSEDPAKTDKVIFGTALDGIEHGEFITDKAKAKKIASCFTKVEGDNLVPSDNTPRNHIRKIMGYNEVVVEKSSVDESGNTIPAVLDYYEDFTTLTGIVIDKITADPGWSGSYLLGSDKSAPVGTEGESSNKKLTVSATAKAKQNEYTRMFFVLERCPINARWNDEKNWKTVMADLGTSGSKPAEEDYAPEYPDASAGNTEFRDWDGDVSKLNMKNFRAYGSDYTYNPLTYDTNGTYTASMSLTYYPGQVIVPGYYYRVRAMLFQYEKDWTNPTLVSLESTKSDKQYVSSGVWGWSTYEYNENDLPVKVTNVEREQTTIKATVRAGSTGFYLDNHYYVRLWKYDETTNQWQILEDDQYYGTISNGGTETGINKAALEVNKTYSLSFNGLTPNTQYQLRFYGLMDSNYDNQLNIRGTSGDPLGGEDKDLQVYKNLPQYQKETDVKLKNSLSELYQKYLGIKSYKEAANLKFDTDEKQAQADKVLLNTSASIRTFATNQSATIGNRYDYKVNASARQIRIFFENASGLGNVQTIDYTISYIGSASGIDTVSGQVIKANGAQSPMDNGGTSGDVELTITDDRLQLGNSGTYYIQLVLRDQAGTMIEKPATINIEVD